MASRYTFRGRTAVVTGAASGIGRAVAGALARRGCHLALADRDGGGLDETARRVGVHGVRVSTHVLDVTDRAAVAALPEAVAAEHGGADVLVNNAGVALGGTFEQVSEADFEWLFEVNFWGVVRMTRAFLPLLKASDDARLVNVSSIFGIIAPPGQVPYVSSKFAVRGFSMALKHELEGTSVGVTVVHPGGVATNIADSARAPEGATEAEIVENRAQAKALLTMPPEKAGEIIVEGVEKRKARVLVGSDARAAAALERLAPVRYWSAIKGRAGR